MNSDNKKGTASTIRLFTSLMTVCLVVAAAAFAVPLHTARSNPLDSQAQAANGVGVAGADLASPAQQVTPTITSTVTATATVVATSATTATAATTSTILNPTTGGDLLQEQRAPQTQLYPISLLALLIVAALIASVLVVSFVKTARDAREIQDDQK